MGCCKCSLVDWDCLKRESRFEDSVKEKQLIPHIIRAHDIELVGLLGQDCVDKLCADKEAGTLTDLQTALVAMLQSWLVEIITDRYLSLGRMKLHAAGPSVPEPGRGFSPDGPNLNPNRTVGAMREDGIRDAEVYRSRILRFMRENAGAAEFECFKVSCGCNKTIFAI